MSRVLVTGGPASLASVILRLLAAGREMFTVVESPTRAAEVRARLAIRARLAQPDARVSFIAADRDEDAGRLDAVAGCEFVDDRIRLRE